MRIIPTHRVLWDFLGANGVIIAFTDQISMKIKITKDQPNYFVSFHSHGQQGEHAHTDCEIRREQVDAAVDWTKDPLSSIETERS